MLSRPLPLTIQKKSPASEMRIWERKLLLFFSDILILTVVLFFCQRAYSPTLDLTIFIQNNHISSIYVISLFLILAFTFNLYNLEYVNKTRKVLPLAFFIGIMTAGFYAATPLITNSIPLQRVPILTFISSFTAALVVWRVFYASVIHSNVFAKNCILLTSEETEPVFIDRIIKSIEGVEFELGLKVLRTYTVSKEQKQIDRLSRAIERMTDKKLIDTVILMDKDQETISNSLNSTLIKVIGKGIQVETYFKLYENVKEAIPIQFGGNQLYTILPISKYNHNYIYLLWHKSIDIVSSLLGLSTMLTLTPFILVTNLFLNKGPLFYRQYRVGKGGKEIEIIKFRSMIVKAEEHGAKMSAKGDLRVTSFGKILRKLRIDELPQFWSVLKGEMSFIGPRPERKIFIDQLVKSIPLYDSRHLIKPGITGWAQVKYEYGENIEDSMKKLEYDLYYVKNRSVTLDIRIIFKTINTILFYKGL